MTVKKIVHQIQGGLNMLNSITQDQRVHDFYPILMYRGKDPTRSLRGRTVSFRGIKRKIIPRECGAKLSSVPHR